MEAFVEGLLAIPGVREALAGLAGHLAPPFLISLIIIWASGKFLKEDIAGKKFALELSEAVKEQGGKLDAELIPLLLLVEGVVLATTYCAVFGYGDGWVQRTTFAVVGGLCSGLAAYCVAAGLYDAAHGVLRHRDNKKEAHK